jgi:ATP dependent DNA ligase domain
MARLRATRPLTLQRKIAARSTNCAKAVGPHYGRNVEINGLDGDTEPRSTQKGVIRCPIIKLADFVSWEHRESAPTSRWSDDNGLAVFDRIRYRRHDGKVFLYAFDLIELNGADLRREPLDVRKATLRSLLVKVAPGLRWNEHIEGDGETIFRHACKLGLEGIVSKRKGSPYRSGRSPDWLKMKNPEAPAVKREAEED